MDIQPYNEQFQKVVNIIESAKERAYRKVNEELITIVILVNLTFLMFLIRCLNMICRNPSFVI